MSKTLIFILDSGTHE